MLTAKGAAKVLDFGLAKILAPSGSGDATRDLTETRGVMGTVPYMAPEQLQGEPVDPRTDIYALGLILYEMATGRHVYQETLGTRLVDAILHRAPVAPRAIQERISPEFERIILKCMEKNPEDRYQSAREVEVDLRRLVSPPSGTVTAPIVPVRRSRKKLLWSIAGGLGLIALLTAAPGRTGRHWRARAARRRPPVCIPRRRHQRERSRSRASRSSWS